MQSFTPRPLIDSDHPRFSAFGLAAHALFRSRGNGQAMVEVMQPKLDVHGSTNVAGGTSPGMGEGRTTQEQLSRKPRATTDTVVSYDCL